MVGNEPYKMKETDYEALLQLLKASSKDVVIRLCNEAFCHHSNPVIPESIRNSTSEVLGITKTESNELLKSLISLVKAAIFQGSTDPADIVTLFPAGFHKNLRDLLGRILIENLPTWKAQAIDNKGVNINGCMEFSKIIQRDAFVSLPRLVDFDWRVDMKTSSDTISRMAVPTCILQLKVQETPTHINQEHKVSAVNVELSKETLDTMLDGLGKIRDQLSSVVKK